MTSGPDPAAGAVSDSVPGWPVTESIAILGYD